MNFEATNRLEYEKVKEHLAEYARTYLGRGHISRLRPLTDIAVIRRLLSEAEEALKLIEHGASVPLPSLEGIESIADGFGKGFLLSVGELSLIGRLLESTDQLKRFMSRKTEIAPNVASYALSLHELREVREELERCIRHGQLLDQASPELAKVRKKIVIAEQRLKKKLEGALQRYRASLQEHVVSMRGDKYVLPVKKEHRKLVPGSVLDESASGQTVFVEPADVAALTFDLSALRAEESREEMKILGSLTDLVESRSYELGINLETIGHYDFLFAKARYALATDARSVGLNEDGYVRICQGRHPLLGKRSVPLDFEIGTAYRSLIITGPNTGGKTVALKTVGLLAMMVQSGLPAPAAEGSCFPIFDRVLADIGDGQSLEQSLSTFSSHVKNLIRILREAGPSTLILLDELATGTDPGEGIGLSIAVLEELHRKGATIVATTHFNEIKQYAEAADGFENARMEFDLDTLQPLYRLKIGEAGHSYAFQIAAKLGMPQAIIDRSAAITYSGGKGSGTGLISLEAALQRSAADQSGAERSGRQSPASGSAPGKHKHAGKPGVSPFEIGDCVWIRSLKRTGIVCELPDERGNVVVMIQKEKVKINVKRLSLYIEKEQLYPADYDMDIVFESKEVRKKRKIMSKRHDETATIIHPPQTD